MDRATFVYHVIDALTVEANSVARDPRPATPYNRAYHLGLTVAQLEALVDELEMQYTHNMNDDDEVTEAGYDRAQEIAATVLAAWTLTEQGWVQKT